MHPLRLALMFLGAFGLAVFTFTVLAPAYAETNYTSIPDAPDVVSKKLAGMKTNLLQEAMVEALNFKAGLVRTALRTQ